MILFPLQSPPKTTMDGIKQKALPLSPISLYEEAKRLTELEIQNDQLCAGNLFNFSKQQQGQQKPRTNLKEGVEPVNFVYGEVAVVDFLRLIKQVGFEEGEVFVDLGCGNGNCLAAAALHRSFLTKEKENAATRETETSTSRCKIVGIDLMRSKLVEGRLMLGHLTSVVAKNSLPALPEIEVLEQDFLKNRYEGI